MGRWNIVDLSEARKRRELERPRARAAGEGHPMIVVPLRTRRTERPDVLLQIGEGVAQVIDVGQAIELAQRLVNAAAELTARGRE
jgi:hypothetical protein